MKEAMKDLLIEEGASIFFEPLSSGGLSASRVSVREQFPSQSDEVIWGADSSFRPRTWTL
jgi:hypothetical protein